MNVAVIGSREGFTKEFIFKNLDEWYKKIKEEKDKTPYKIDYNCIHMFTGGAKGVDKFAEEWFISRAFREAIIIRPINPASKIDYLYRNIEIITKADKIIAFWSNNSRGTKFVIDYAKARGKDIIIIKSTTKDELDKKLFSSAVQKVLTR